MTRLQEKSKRVLWFHESHSPVKVQRRFVREFRKTPPDVKGVNSW